ncbi:neurotrypsin-like [Diadema antillarum]|uniref:neurotrypsin-like n=1 Tax=Diadema antillarum TaxID=105358 RepID=UPI003A88226F
MLVVLVLTVHMFVCSSTAALSVQGSDVRLAGGESSNEGRVELKVNGSWSTICDDEWGFREAWVICRMLGYPGADSAVKNAEFGPGTGTILLDEVMCEGSEIDILECAHDGFGVHDCDHYEDAGVVCSNTTARETPVRLVGGQNPWEGRVELYYNDNWNTVCDDNWDILDARVICSMLGYLGALRSPSMAAFGSGTGPILLDEVTCEGGESDILDCFHDGLGVHDCSHSEDAGVVCSNLTVRLVGDNGEHGLVEIYRDGAWSKVCSDTWGLAETNVTCRILGFPGIMDYGVTPADGINSSAVFSYGIRCTGNETNLDDCSHHLKRNDTYNACIELVHVSCGIKGEKADPML